jgi:hypothetical protein
LRSLVELPVQRAIRRASLTIWSACKGNAVGCFFLSLLAFAKTLHFFVRIAESTRNLLQNFVLSADTRWHEL